METKITGKAWVGGDNISTYAITPQRRWNLDKMDPEELGKWAMEDADPAFADKEGAFRDSGYSIVVAGACFGGGGKSIEHPIYALQGAGIKVVIADSFARFNFRNSVNNALPVFTCPGLKETVQTGDELTVLQHRRPDGYSALFWLFSGIYAETPFMALALNGVLSTG